MSNDEEFLDTDYKNWLIDESSVAKPDELTRVSQISTKNNFV